jgi:hypothetical protein
MVHAAYAPCEPCQRGDQARSPFRRSCACFWTPAACGLACTSVHRVSAVAQFLPAARASRASVDQHLSVQKSRNIINKLHLWTTDSWRPDDATQRSSSSHASSLTNYLKSAKKTWASTCDTNYDLTGELNPRETISCACTTRFTHRCVRRAS